MMLTPEESAGLSAVAALYGMKARKEVEIAILRRTTAPDNLALRQAELELDALNRKVATLPEVGLRSLRLYRDVIIQQQIIEYLTPVFEQARIDEQKEIPVVLVLDEAVPAERKARPQRMLITASLSVLGFFALMVLAFVMEGLLRRAGDDRPPVARLRRMASAVSRRYRIAPGGER